MKNSLNSVSTCLKVVDTRRDERHRHEASNTFGTVSVPISHAPTVHDSLDEKD